MAKNIDTAKNFIAAATNIVQALGEVNPREDEFDELLQRHERLCRNALNYMDLQERVSFFLGEMAEIENDNDNAVTIPLTSKVSQITELKPKPVEEHPVEQPFPEPEETEEPENETEQPTYTLDEVKAAFIPAAKKGIDVGGIISSFGYAKLSDVPTEQYGSLMEALKKAEAGA